MNREVLYRKWRPRTFAELAGQDAVSRTLTNAVATGKVAHAYLFSGPRGTGKTTTGRLLAKAVNCTNPKEGDPCNKCDNCKAYVDGRALDLIELDAASNRGIDEIRSLREKANFAPAGGEGAFKVYLVDEVHMLTEPAFNALLKTLEEPPAHVIFVLATTDAHKVPATVVSRCQRFDFRRIPLSAAVDRLSLVAKAEEIECSSDALEAIARAATGSLRDAINLLEQLSDTYGANLTLEQVREGLDLVVDGRSVELSANALRGELAEGLALIAAVRDDGLDLRQFKKQVVAYLRATLLVKVGSPPSEAYSEEQVSVMQELVEHISTDRVVAALRAFGEADLRADPLSPLPLELALASCALADTAAPAAGMAPALAASSQPVVPETPKPRAASVALPANKAPAVAGSSPQATPSPPKQRAESNGTPSPNTRNTAAAKPAEKPPAKQPKNATPEAKAETPGEVSPGTRSAASDSTGDMTPELAEARSRWQEIYDRTRKLEYRSGALLNSGCGIVQASTDEVTFGFLHAMLLERMQGDGGENMRALQQAVDDVLGKGRAVRCVLDPSVDVQRPQRGGHLVRAAEELGGQILSSDD